MALRPNVLSCRDPRCLKRSARATDDQRAEIISASATHDIADERAHGESNLPLGSGEMLGTSASSIAGNQSMVPGPKSAA